MDDVQKKEKVSDQSKMRQRNEGNKGRNDGIEITEVSSNEERKERLNEREQEKISKWKVVSTSNCCTVVKREKLTGSEYGE
jgi:hypothetical protein